MQTIADIGNLKGSSNAVTRWATFGPYYAMFPIDFAFEVIENQHQSLPVFPTLFSLPQNNLD